MSWFDKLFGEDNDSSNSYLNKRNQRRQRANERERHDSLHSQNNDVYERPRGKFRFPINGLDETEGSHHNDEVNESTSYRHEQTEPDFMSDQGQRRRRRQSNEADSTSQNNRNNSSYTSTKRKQSSIEHKPKQHKGTRMRIQTDALRASSNTKQNRSKPLYHQREFKASEVPSAIFGTKTPKPLKAGKIVTSNNSEDTSDSKQQETKRDYSSTGHSKTSSSESNRSEVRQQHSETSNTSNKQGTPEGKNNTINIENIYASQIVEEIRRERERKVNQKKQFKKALQQKRQQYQQNDSDSIQKAIDEMYAKQAKDYLGESSLDDLELDDIDSQNDEQHNSTQSETNTLHESNHANDASQHEGGLYSPFNYEEVDLDNVSNVHTDANETQIIEDVEDENNEQDSVETSSNNEDTESNHSEQSHLEEVQLSNPQQTNTENGTTSTTNIDENITDNQYSESNTSPENEVTEANYREIDESSSNKQHDEDSDIHETSSKEETDGENISNDQLTENTQTSEFKEDNSETSNLTEEQSTGSEHSSHVVSETPTSDIDLVDNDNDSNNDETDERSENINQNEETQSQYESTKHHSENQPQATESSIVNNSHDTASNQQSSDVENAKNNEKSTEPRTSKEQPNSNIKKRPKKSGGSPFNVVMTPSDKKRMMDAQKEKYISQHKDISNNLVDQQQEESNETMSVEDDSDKDKNEPPSQNKANLEKPSSGTTSSTQEKQKVTEPPLKPEVSNQQAVEHSVEQTVEQPSQDSQNKNSLRKGPMIQLPSTTLLEEPEEIKVDNEWIEEKKQELNEAFYYFNVPAEVQNVTEGPSVTRFELSVEKGVKVSRITALQDDIKMALAAKDIRIEAPIPGTSLVGIEVPNQSSTKVNLRSIIESPSFKNAESKLTVAMGYRINNEPLLMDIAKTPHALIAGATGSGKSVCINSILMSLLYKNHPEELKLLLIDPKMVELAPYNDLPHLVSPVITDVKAATQSLKWAVDEMERRYKVFAKYHVRNISAFNKKAPYEDRMAKIVIVIDELADLMMMAPQEVEQSIARLAQKARASGIHMLVATQRPSVNVITGLIKANIPTRIAFMVSSSVDSRTILDSGGAERLLGYGDMLYLGNGMNKPIRVQGTFVSDDEIDDVVDYIKQQREPEYLFEEKELLKKTEAQPQDELFNDVCQFMVREGHISTSLIQRQFQIGYNRAARIVDQLEQLGYVSGANGSKPRDVYMTEADLNDT
ncbi:DNA translocase FtsK [Staphylococcus sp. Marseille-Q6910]|uniref:DNA translocase FtsK n=1 Tax=Staphylococcus sp. Marseille-Q6910 TaxID=2937990 RepID=UPI00203C8564|nr:DNA translocase FtsK [Staphylococcus sp. Marseille-Q6910]